MNKNKDFFDSHISFQGIGFGSKQKDDAVAKKMKKTVKGHLKK